jgi:hypothetical protein
MHMMLQAPKHERLITHIFVKDSPYLDSDAVFGVRNSLVVDFPKHQPGKAPDGRTMNKPYWQYDFKLVPSALMPVPLHASRADTSRRPGSSPAGAPRSGASPKRKPWIPAYAGMTE